jgi:hypothetical protein
MRKRTIQPTAPAAGATLDWLPLEQIATVEVSSEQTSHPIEDALLSRAQTGWRASQTGEQLIRLIFDTPQRLRHIQLLFREDETARSQEFVLRWSPDRGRTFHEIVRQQWNFSPPGTTEEAEDYRVDLTGVTILELNIVPNRNGGAAQASLEAFKLA